MRNDTSMTPRRIAVVGGGIFGTTAAIHLARAGHNVELFEQGPTLLGGASHKNQYRLHRGYHYPRSKETAISCRDDVVSFNDEYQKAVVARPATCPHYY